MQVLVKLSWIVIRKNTHEQVMGRRPLTAEVPKRPCREMVAPDVCKQKRPRKRATNSAGIVPKVEVP
jgi:hypothetical protein